MSASPESLRFDRDRMWVELEDGRTVGVPLAWFPRLLRASKESREDFELSHLGIHWDAIDENVSVAGLLMGVGDQTRTGQQPPTTQDGSGESETAG